MILAVESSTHWLVAVEWLAALLSLVCVLLTIGQNIWCWPSGLAAVALYFVVFWQARLYSDMLLQVVYVFLQLYGWRAWSRSGPQRGVLKVGRLSAGEMALWLALAAAASLALGAAMRQGTDASFPYWDALATVVSLVSQWLMARKVLESWLGWILVDVVSIGLYAAKDLRPTAALYVLFLGMAIWGYFQWRRSWRKDQPRGASA